MQGRPRGIRSRATHMQCEDSPIVISGAGGLAQFVTKDFVHLPVHRRTILRPERGLVPVNCGFKSPRFCLRISLLLRIFQMATRKETSQPENKSKQSRSFYVQSVISCGVFPIPTCVHQMLSNSFSRRQRSFVSAAPCSTITTLDSP